MPQKKPAGKTEEAKKLTTSFQWLDRETWPALEELAQKQGFASVGLFARHLCEEALKNPEGVSPAAPVTPPVALAHVTDQLSDVIATIGSLREEIQKLASADATEEAVKVRRAVRGLDDTIKAEFVQLRADATKQIADAGTELRELRLALAVAAAAIVTEVKPQMTKEQVNEWVAKRFFPGFKANG